MARTLLALLLFCFVTLHAALPSAAAIEEPTTIVSLLPDDPADDGEDAAPLTPDAATKCHDSCNWLAAWHAPALREVHRSPLERRALSIRPGLLSQVVPPPK
ncbi:MAG: hypothetical protein ABJG86_19265 [Nitratireductor sp.]|uniref:hypothetical protein n=1 Tax=Alphaproteobacteria TaxID=28211 RepID=UPI00326667F7